MHLRKKLSLAISIACLASIPLFAGSKSKSPEADISNWSIGIFLGEPTGVTAQVDIADAQALEFKAAWNFVSTSQASTDSGTVTLQGNYVVWFPGVLTFDGHDFPPFVGGGAEVRIGTDLPLLGIRIPFGVRYRFREAPLEISLELGAGMSLFPSTAFMGSGGLAIRWML